MLLAVVLVAQPTLLALLDDLSPLLHPIRISYLQYLSHFLPGAPFFLTICYAVFQALGVFSLISSAFSSRLIIVRLRIMDGSADDKTMLNYLTRTVEPILSAIVDEMKRKFLTKTARSQKQSILFFRDPFKLVPVGEIAEIADKMTRNEIMTSNEIRQKIGLMPSTDPNADKLRNSNLSAPKEESTEQTKSKEDKVQNGSEV